MYLKVYANHLPGVQVMETISLQCNGLSQCLLQAENSMTGRAYIGEVLTQVWLKSIFDIQVNAQKENLKKYFQGSCELPQAHEKVCDENETKKKENDEHLKYFVMEGRSL